MKKHTGLTQEQMDELYIAFCKENGIVMDSDNDREDYAARGHLYTYEGSDVHDGLARP